MALTTADAQNKEFRGEGSNSSENMQTKSTLVSYSMRRICWAQKESENKGSSFRMALAGPQVAGRVGQGF
jgi:hypothetical protein